MSQQLDGEQGRPPTPGLHIKKLNVPTLGPAAPDVDATVPKETHIYSRYTDFDSSSAISQNSPKRVQHHPR